MAKPISAIALVVAIVAAIFYFAHLADGFLMVLVIGTLLLLAIGNLLNK